MSKTHSHADQDESKGGFWSSFSDIVFQIMIMFMVVSLARGDIRKPDQPEVIPLDQHEETLRQLDYWKHRAAQEEARRIEALQEHLGQAPERDGKPPLRISLQSNDALYVKGLGGSLDHTYDSLDSLIRVLEDQDMTRFGFVALITRPNERNDKTFDAYFELVSHFGSEIRIKWEVYRPHSD